MREPLFHIRPVRSAADLDATVRLFEAYAASLDIDLAFQDFAAEIAAMPGRYAPPAGELLLARGAEGEPLGCVALRPMPLEGRCEMKRLAYNSVESLAAKLERLEETRLTLTSLRAQALAENPPTSMFPRRRRTH